MFYVVVDKITPCLIDTETGDIVETEVVRLRRKSYISKFSEKSYWYTDWKKLIENGDEIYGLVIKGTTSIQGLVALHPDYDNQAVYGVWAVAAPHNNPMITDEKKFSGVGGHLFAIVADRSVQLGFGGALYVDAANDKLAAHYCDTFGAFSIATSQFPRRVFIDEANARQIMEVYHYEWTDEEL